MSCESLRNYGSKSDAKRAMKRTQSKVPGGTASRIYRCPGCGQWHIARRRPPAGEGRGS
jgi:ribosomal protein L32